MEVQQLKEIWLEYDKKLEKQVKLNVQMLKTMNLDKTRSSLQQFVRTPTLGLVIGLIVQMAMGAFIYHHLSMPQYVITAALIWVFALFQVISSGYQLSILLPTRVGGEINYDTPVTEIQKKLERLKIYRVRYLTVTRFSYGLLWLPVVIVGLKAFFDFDFFVYFDHLWILAVILCGVACAAFGIWLSRKAGAKKNTSSFLQKVIDNIAANDITGKGLTSAMAFLKVIEDFEKED